MVFSNLYGTYGCLCFVDLIVVVATLGDFYAVFVYFDIIDTGAVIGWESGRSTGLNIMLSGNKRMVYEVSFPRHICLLWSTSGKCTWCLFRIIR